MCLGFEGVLTEVRGTGLERTGILTVGDRRYPVALTFAPDAREGDTVVAHSGQVVRVVQTSLKNVSERA